MNFSPPSSLPYLDPPELFNIAFLSAGASCHGRPLFPDLTDLLNCITSRVLCHSPGQAYNIEGDNLLHPATDLPLYRLNGESRVSPSTLCLRTRSLTMCPTF